MPLHKLNPMLKPGSWFKQPDGTRIFLQAIDGDVAWVKTREDELPRPCPLDDLAPAVPVS